MINIDQDRLNPLETRIHETLVNLAKVSETITINQAAEACDCSVSKISKFAKKMGFENFKQYVEFIHGKEVAQKATSDELTRIRSFIDDFDERIVDEFIKLLDSHSKIILFGYGPSFLCTQYLEYKLRITMNKVVIAIQDDLSLDSLMDENTLVVIFSATGKFKSFERLKQMTQDKKSDLLMINEEYNPALLSSFDKIFWLSKYNQPDDLKPYEKSRIVFYIFIEEVVRKIIARNRQISEYQAQNAEPQDTQNPQK